MDQRMSKDKYYLNIADAVLDRSTCLRRKYGAIIVKNDEILSTGYNGAPRGRVNCSELGYCNREQLRIPSGQRYELCRSVHAEANAITKVAKSANNCDGSTLYITAAPCIECSKLIIQAGIRRVVYSDDYRSEEGLDLLRRVGIECVQYRLDRE
jgi:dCMP deaminase